MLNTMKSTRGQIWSLIASILPQLLLLPGAYAACAPGGKFDLSRWNLQLPSGSPGSPDTISSSSLQGCGGYSNPNYFFLGSDGSLVMKVPSASSGCVTTPNSKHCRTELRESNPRSWDPTLGLNRLSATLTVVSAGGSTCIGQIHIDESISTKPVAELYYDNDGNIKMGVAQTIEGGNQILTNIGNVPVGTKFSYEIRYESGSLSVILNGNQKTLSTYNLNNPRSYFKAGNYVQGSGASEVHFHSINVSHGSTGSQNRPSAADSSCNAQPDNASDNTVTLNLYSQNSCCGTLVQKIKIGNLNVCHNGNAAFSSLNMKVGQNLFGKSNHVLLYSGRDCTGTVWQQDLTNAAKCWQGTTWQSFMVAPPSQAKRWVS